MRRGFSTRVWWRATGNGPRYDRLCEIAGKAVQRDLTLATAKFGALAAPYRGWTRLKQ